MDCETGEYYPDIETGELFYMPCLNSETGEKEPPKPVQSRRPFKIPIDFYNRYNKKPTKKQVTRPDHRVELLTAVTFLLPTTIFFLPVVSVILLVFELILHNWSHKQNNLLKNNKIDNIYYQSPLHIIVRRFCATCYEEDYLLKISKLQQDDSRSRVNQLKKYSFEYVRRIV